MAYYLQNQATTTGPGTSLSIAPLGMNIDQLVIVISGTATSHQVSFWAAQDGGVNWVPIEGVNNATGAVASKTTGAFNESWSISLGRTMYNYFKANIDSVSGGYVTVTAGF
jgi:hypothetical protein